MNERILSTIQKREKLNVVKSVDKEGPGGAHHKYIIERNDNSHSSLLSIQFQEGPRKESDSIPGIIDSDLLEICRDRLISFQNGEFSSEYNRLALMHIEEALMYLNRRVEDRIEREVLGKNEK